MNRPRGVPRHRSRQAALQVLYAFDLAQSSRTGTPQNSDDVFEGVAANFELPEAARAFAKELVCGVVEHRDDIDALLSVHATNWRVSRMAAVDRNILRIGAYELTRSDVPVRIVLDEAIELARRYGGELSPPFVNGVLDAVARACRNGEGAVAPRRHAGPGLLEDGSDSGEGAG